MYPHRDKGGGQDQSLLQSHRADCEAVAVPVVVE